MNTRSEILRLLQENKGRYLSGQEIGESLQISRNGVWKAIEQLRKDGYHIESKTRIGYKLIGGLNSLSISEIKPFLKKEVDLYVIDTVASTSDLCRTKALSGKPLLIVANKQTSGRGRLGRTFFSPAGTGLYMSLALKPNFSLQDSLYVTMATALAVVNAIEEVTGKKAKIKWVNDIFLNGKKVSGILTEAESNFEVGQIEKLIIGIGINCFGTFTGELSKIATSISPSTKDFSRSQLAATTINNLLEYLDELDKTKIITEYRRKCFILGKEVLVRENYQDAKGLRARAIDIDQNGGLIVEFLEGKESRQIKTLTTGEVSLRLSSML